MGTAESNLRLGGLNPGSSAFTRGCCRFIIRILAVSALAVALLHAAEPAAPISPEETERLARYLRYPSLLRLTETMVPMDMKVTMMCARPPGPPTFISDPPHTGASIRLYASRQAVDKAAMWTIDARFPIGTLLVKEKFESKASTEANLITVMEKVRNEGKVDDWLFTMIALPERTIVRERPKVACIECHAKFTRTDFVSGITFGALQTYLRKNPDRPSVELQLSPGPTPVPPTKTTWEPVSPPKLSPRN